MTQLLRGLPTHPLISLGHYRFSLQLRIGVLTLPAFDLIAVVHMLLGRKIPRCFIEPLLDIATTMHIVTCDIFDLSILLGLNRDVLTPMPLPCRMVLGSDYSAAHDSRTRHASRIYLHDLGPHVDNRRGSFVILCSIALAKVLIPRRLDASSGSPRCRACLAMLYHLPTPDHPCRRQSPTRRRCLRQPQHQRPGRGMTSVLLLCANLPASCHSLVMRSTADDGYPI